MKVILFIFLNFSVSKILITSKPEFSKFFKFFYPISVIKGGSQKTHKGLSLNLFFNTHATYELSLPPPTGTTTS